MSKSKRKREVATQISKPFFPSWFVASALGWATFVFILCLRYYSQHVPVGPALYFQQLSAESTLGPNFANFWLGHLLRTFGCALFFWGAWSVGDVFLRLFFLGNEDKRLMPLKIPFSLGLGLGTLGYLAFGIIAIGLAHKWIMIVLYAALCLFGVKQTLLFYRAASNNAESKAPEPSPGFFEKTVSAFLFIALAFAFLGTTVPEISYDALVYHLAVPQTYLFAGRMINLPHNHFSYLPLLTSMLYFWGLALDGMYLAKLISFGIGLCVTIGLYQWGKVLKDRVLGLTASAIWMGTPLVLYLFWMTNSDLGTAFFLLLSLMAAWGWLQNLETNGRFLYLAGLSLSRGNARP